MPPKIRRPAAVLGGRLRRPAGAPGIGPDAWVQSHSFRLEECAPGTSLVIEGEYWEGAADVCGQVLGGTLEGGQRYLKLRGTGTRSEGLLKFLSGSRARELQVHLCGQPCEAKVWRDGLIHASRLRQVVGEREAWMDNLGEMIHHVEEDADDNPEMRREAEEARRAIIELEARRKARPGREEEAKQVAKKKKERKRPRASEARKDLTAVFGATGLDPDPAIRKQVVRAAKKVRKKAKKKSKKSSSSKGSSRSSTTSSSSDLMLDTEIFEGQRESQKLWRKTPGALSLATLVEAQQNLLTRQGIQPDVTSANIPPLMVQYFRANMQGSMTPALARESHHWAMLIDLLLKGEIARGCDLACQRLKSLESYSRGTLLDISRNLELLPPERASLTTQTEAAKAGKLAAEETKFNQRTRFSGKGAEASGGAYGGKKGKSKGEGKKGKTDGKAPKKGKEDDSQKAA